MEYIQGHDFFFFLFVWNKNNKDIKLGLRKEIEKEK